MLVVDRRLFTQLQADYSGIDFMELSANLIRNRHRFEGSSASVLDSENAYKIRSSTSVNCFPPSYEDIFGTKNCDLPPSYSEVSIMLKNNGKGKTQEHVTDVETSAKKRLLWTSVEVLKKSLHNIYQQTQFSVRNSRISRSMNDLAVGNRLQQNNTVLKPYFLCNKSLQTREPHIQNQNIQIPSCSTNYNSSINQKPLLVVNQQLNNENTLETIENQSQNSTVPNFEESHININDGIQGVLLASNSKLENSFSCTTYASSTVDDVTERETCL